MITPEPPAVPAKLRQLVERFEEMRHDRTERWRGWGGAMSVAASDLKAALDQIEREAAGAVPDTGRPTTEPLLAQLRREQAAIDAHHARKASHRLHWVWSLGHRKPWRSSGPVPWRHLPSLFEWVRNAHDCSDASLMCSCAGSPRFPRRVEAL